MASKAPGDRRAYERAYQMSLGKGLGAFLDAMRNWRQSPLERHEDPKPMTRVTKCEGPMLYIGQQIVKRMGKMGYPSKIHEHFRTPERQATLKSQGASKASGWSSPHQFGEAVDIIHKTKGWQVPPEYWEALASVVRVIEADLRVELTHGHYWKFVDSAHIELTDWRSVKIEQQRRMKHYHKPSPEELLARWKQVLPAIKPDTSLIAVRTL